MSGILLTETSFQNILPSSVRQDSKFAAAAKALDCQFARYHAVKHVPLIWSRIDDIDEPLLSNLAYEKHLDGYEGWHLAETLKQKQDLVKEAIVLHRLKGTRYSLERTFEILDMRGLVTEWWEAPEDPDFPPYTFDIDIEATRSITEKFYNDVIKLIYALKNLRSHLRKMRIFLTYRGKVPVIASALITGLEITLYPFRTENIEMKSRIPAVAATCQTIQQITVQPWRSAFFRDDGEGNIRMADQIIDGSTDPLFRLDASGNIRLKDSVSDEARNGFFRIDENDNVKMED